MKNMNWPIFRVAFLWSPVGTAITAEIRRNVTEIHALTPIFNSSARNPLKKNYKIYFWINSRNRRNYFPRVFGNICVEVDVFPSPCTVDDWTSVRYFLSALCARAMSGAPASLTHHCAGTCKRFAQQYFSTRERKFSCV